MIKGASINSTSKVTLESKFILLTILAICFLATGGIFVKLNPNINNFKGDILAFIASIFY